MGRNNGWRANASDSSYFVQTRTRQSHLHGLATPFIESLSGWIGGICVTHRGAPVIKLLISSMLLHRTDYRKGSKKALRGVIDMNNGYAKLLDQIIAVARSAGTIILEIYASDFDVTRKMWPPAPMCLNLAGLKLLIVLGRAGRRAQAIRA